MAHADAGPRWLRWPATVANRGLAYGPVLTAADVHSGLPEALRGRVEHTVRSRDGIEFHFLVNLTDDPVAMGDVEGDRLAVVGDAATIAPRDVAVIQRRP
jgi:hypothetical protein